MINLKYSSFVYQPVENPFITDDEINIKLAKLNINQYAKLERFNDKLIIKFEIPGSRLICLSDLINCHIYKQFDLQYTLYSINSILEELQNKYERNKQCVSLNLQDIWVGNEMKIDKQVEVLFTYLQFEQQNYHPDIEQLKNTIINLLQKHKQTNDAKIQMIIAQLQQCNLINEIKQLIKINLGISIQINQQQVKIDENVEKAFNNQNEIQEGLNNQNYHVLKSNLINWIVTGKYSFDRDVTIKDIFLKLNLKFAYKIFTQWSDLNSIFMILQEKRILNSLSGLQNIENYISFLTFPKSNNLFVYQNCKQGTLNWIEKVEQVIRTKIGHYEQNLSEFYKRDKDIYQKVDFKLIFSQVRRRFDENIYSTENPLIIEQMDFIQQNTEEIIKQYYVEIVKQINLEIVKIIFKQK